MTKLILFDVDGTLITGVKGHHKAFVEAIKKVYGIDIKIEDGVHDGKTDPQIIFELLTEQGLSKEDIDADIGRCMREMVRSFEMNLPDDEIILLDGADYLLDYLDKSKFILGLITGNVEGIAWLKMEKTGIAGHFHIGGFGSDDPVRSNLIKIAIQRAVDKFQFKHDNNVFIIGDTPRDIAAGKEAGVKTIAVATGVFSREELEKAEPDFVFNNLSEAKNTLIQ